jgi:hydroxymethylpyrimidine/phosphomethylpyrimidine kinase
MTHIAPPAASLEATPCVLTIGGLDPSGGAGLTADARAVKAFGAHALPVISAVVAQNTRGVRSWEAVSAGMLHDQLDALFEDFWPDAIKIGLLPHIECAEVVLSSLIGRLNANRTPIIWDTVFAPSSGPAFSSGEVVRYLSEHLLPECEIVTPNIPEAAQLSGLPPATTIHEMHDTARTLWRMNGSAHVLLKGGHLPGESGAESVDVLFNGTEFLELNAPRISGYEVRGTGCLLASAIAAQRAQNVPIPEAVRNAKKWLTEQIRNATAIGGGRRVAV